MGQKSGGGVLRAAHVLLYSERAGQLQWLMTPKLRRMIRFRPHHALVCMSPERDLDFISGLHRS